MKKLLKLFILIFAIATLITGSVYASIIDTPKVISGTLQAGVPTIEVNGGNVYASFAGPEGIFFTKSTDGGATFTNPVLIATDIAVGEISIAAVGNTLYVVGSTFENDIGRVHLVKSTDSGNTFLTPQVISETSSSPMHLVIEASGTSVYVSWQHEEFGNQNTQILFIRSMDNGNTFSLPVLLSNPATQTDQPSIAASGKDVYVSWVEEVIGEPTRALIVAHSTDFGVSFPQIISVPGAAKVDVPTMVINKKGDKVFIAWRDDELDPIRSIEFAKSDDFGLTFTSPTTIASGGVDLPDLALNNKGDLNLVWFQENDIFFSRSVDEGNTFSTNENISQDTFGSFSPTIGLNNMGTGFVAWGKTVFATNENTILFTTITP